MADRDERARAEFLGDPSMNPMTGAVAARDIEPINFHFYSSLRISVATRFKSTTARNALYLVEFYVNGLVVQWNRIADDMNLANRIQWSGEISTNVDAAKAFVQLQDRFRLDIHFYLICWDKIDKHFELFDRAQSESDITSVRARIRDLLSKGALARHFLEHLDKHVPEGEVGIRSAAIGSDGRFTFTYEDVSRKGEKHERSVALGRAEVIRVLHAYIDVLERLGVDPQNLRPRP
jgi:hypothetical protein